MPFSRELARVRHSHPIDWYFLWLPKLFSPYGYDLPYIQLPNLRAQALQSMESFFLAICATIMVAQGGVAVIGLRYKISI
jgi:hypothetical protein